MNDQDNKYALKAELKSFEQEFALFKTADIQSNEENVVKWPTTKLPQGIDIGDTVDFNLHFELEEERKHLMKKQQEEEQKLDYKRRLLEDLVN